MRLLSIGCLLWCACPAAWAQVPRHTVSGYVREAGSGELLTGVTVAVAGRSLGVATNTYGFYSLTLPADSVTLVFSFVGYAPLARQFNLDRDAELNVDLAPQATALREVVVAGSQRGRVSESVQMSSIDVPIRQIKDIPALLGEKDVLKVLQLMPGVQKGGEGNGGLYVRGGGPDQNLIILDDAVVYNAYHLFGFFSLFNGDALKSVELTKGGFPARYGGRLSSVVEMTMKEGNKEKLHGEGGIGLLSARLTLEGPLVRNKSSFLVSARRTYIDALLYPFLPANEKFGYNFYDLTAKANYDFGRRNKLYLSGYFGRDRFGANSGSRDSRSEAGLNWGNATATVRWNHLFTNRLFANTSLIFSNYRLNIFNRETRTDQTYELNYGSGIRDLGAKMDFDYLPSPQHAVRFGIQTTWHRFTPSAVVVVDTRAGQNESRVRAIDGLESAAYVEDTYKPNNRLTINGGFRVSHFVNGGRQYLNPEPRLSAAYRLRPDLALKASFASMNQYIHLLSNTGVGLPTDLWVPSTPNVRPQRSNQVAAGVAKDFDRGWSLTVEGYYKKMSNVLAYRDGASFLLIDDPSNADQVDWETNVTSGQAWSYGTEVLLQRKIGKFSGWLGYTLSWTQLQFDEINFGRKYFARYDRRHDLSLVGVYRLTDRITLSGTWVYGTGNAITLPQGQFQTTLNRPGRALPNDNLFFVPNLSSDYGARNNFRMAAYQRLDLGIQFHKKKRWGERTWEISVYNVYNRMNPYFYYLQSEQVGANTPGQPFEQRQVLKQITLFPIIPSFSYNVKF